MKVALVVACAALLAVPAATASREDGFYRRPHVPLQWEQHRAVSLLARRGDVVYCGGGRSNAVALTFDDGPGPYTAQLVAALRAAGAHATFFVVANRVRYWPEDVRAERAVATIGNHTYPHPHLSALPPWIVWLELLRAQSDARAVLGWKPRLFRAPYEQHGPVVDSVVRRLRLLQVLWSVDSRDWAPRSSVRSVVRNVVAGLRPGAIVLLHDIHPWTVAAVPEILRAIRLRHLRLVTVAQLYAGRR